MRSALVLVVVVGAAAAMFAMLVALGPTSAKARAHLSTAASTPTTPPAPASPPPPSSMSRPFPRLMASGFEGLSTSDMASEEAVARVFAGLQVVRGEPPQLALRDRANGDVATIYFDEEHGANKVSLEKPGIVTEHGLQVGAPLAAVLDLHVRHQCETISSLLSSAGPVYRAIRCWVGKRPARFRYVASLPEAPFGTAAALFEPRPLSKEEVIPDRGAALDRWIETSDLKIDQILWRNDLEYER